MTDVANAIYFKTVGPFKWEFGCDHDLAYALEYGTDKTQATTFISGAIFENGDSILNCAKTAGLNVLKK